INHIIVNWDSDGDGIRDRDDDFPDDAAASLDSDGDGCPDEWNAGKGQSDSTTDLELDLFPNDPDQSTFDFVTISSGSFMMGSTTGESDEEPVHQVNIGYGFQMGKFEVTQAQWEAVMGTTPWSGEDYVQQGENNPAVFISWNDCQDFVSALNDLDPDYIYRLPSESEWEYCCRAGSTADYCYGNDSGDLGDYAWCYDNTWHVGEAYAHEVGTKLPNAWGLYDMHGNVNEWCQDWFHYGYNGAPNDGTAWEDPEGSYRVVRGGCFGCSVYSFRSSKCRSWYRSYDDPDDSYEGLGLRLVRVQA
ncbi:MAG: formylglycine-generating enzyme family protein, partial [Thermoplasmatota archaeon]